MNVSFPLHVMHFKHAPCQNSQCLFCIFFSSWCCSPSFHLYLLQSVLLLFSSVTYSAGLSGTETTQLHAWCEPAFFLGLLCEDESRFSFSPFQSAFLACLHEYCLAFDIEMLTLGCTVKHPNSFGVPKPALESWICCTWILTRRSRRRSEPTMLGHG